MKGTRTVAAIFLIAVMPQLTGCIVRRERLLPPQQLAPAAPPSRYQPKLVGITTSDNSVMMFDLSAAATVSGDTIYAHRGGSPYTVSLVHVGAMWMALPGLEPVTVPPSDLARAAAMMEPLQRNVVGVATTSGLDLQFTSGRPVAIAQDTLYATVRGSAYKIPLAQVQGVRVLGVHVGRSLLKSFGLAALVTAGLAIVTAVGFLISPPAMG